MAGDLFGVTGATGGVGGRVATRLAGSGYSQRLIVRDKSRAPDLSGSQAAEASYDDPEAMRRALAGVETLFMVSAAEAADRVRQHIAAIDAAVAAGVGRIVYLSFLGAAPEATFTFARDHWHTEEHVRATGVRHTFLRDSMYMDFLPTFAGTDGVIRGPAGDGHDERTYDVTGSEAITLHQQRRDLYRRLGLR